MTVKEAKQLIEQLDAEIESGVDVEFNTEWKGLLQKQVLDASIKGFNEAIATINK